MNAVMFVELLVCGAGVLVWLILALAILLDIDPVALTRSLASLSAALFAVLTLAAYALGVCVDRIADISFSWFSHRWAWPSRMIELLLRRHDDSLKGTRIRVAAQEGKLTEHLEYFRHRERIARGVVFNAFATFVVLLGNRARGRTILSVNELAIPVYVLTFFALLLTIVGWLAWSFIEHTYESRKPVVEKTLKQKEVPGREEGT